MINHIIIGIIFNQPMTGYDIKKEVELGVGNFCKISYGSLYPALKKLTEQGMLTMTEKPQGGRIKKYYQATEKGKELFLEWLAAPFDPKSSDNPLVKIYFFGELPPDIRQKRLDELEHHNTLMLHQLEQMEKQFADEELNDRYYFELSTLYYGIINGHTTKRWLVHLKEQRPHAELLDN